MVRTKTDELQAEIFQLHQQERQLTWRNELLGAKMIAKRISKLKKQLKTIQNGN